LRRTKSMPLLRSLDSVNAVTARACPTFSPARPVVRPTSRLAVAFEGRLPRWNSSLSRLRFAGRLRPRRFGHLSRLSVVGHRFSLRHKAVTYFLPTDAGRSDQRRPDSLLDRARRRCSFSSCLNFIADSATEESRCVCVVASQPMAGATSPSSCHRSGQ